MHTLPTRLTLTVVSLIVLTTSPSGLSGWQQQSPPVPLIPQDLKEEDKDRERYQKATDVLKALEVSKGNWVADVGAGNGYYVQRMAGLVGPTGKVFAEDISDHSIEWLHQRVKAYDLSNVEVVKGERVDSSSTSDLRRFGALLTGGITGTTRLRRRYVTT